MHLTADRHKLIILLYYLDEISARSERIGAYEVYARSESSKHYVFYDSAKKLEHYFPYSEKQLREWCTKKNPKEQHGGLDEALLEFLGEFFKDVEAPISGNQIGVMEFAKRLGFAPSRARYIIDRQYAYDLPTFSSLSSSLPQASRFVERYGGVYYLYRHDINESVDNRFPQGLLLRSTLSIRYPVVYSSLGSEKPEYFRVRCKLNIPCYNEDFAADIFKYDGYVADKKKDWWHWLFQGRSYGEHPSDLLMMYTEAPSKGSLAECMVGVMMTQSQSSNLLPCLSKVVLVRKGGVRMEKAMVYDEATLIRMRRRSAKKANQFYRMVPDEIPFMDDEVAYIDLANRKAWTETDNLAIQCLFSKPLPINLNGLHLM